MIDFFSRLDNFMKFKGLNDNKITVEASIANGIIGKARKRGALSQENISKILFRYPELNANWLFTGNGDMILKNTVSSGVSKPDQECKSCFEKDKTIASLNKLIELQDAKISSNTFRSAYKQSDTNSIAAEPESELK